MAFCKQCGAELNGANFCPSCGTAANADIAAAQPQNTAPVGADARQRSLADLDHMIRYFGVKQAQYDEYDALREEVEIRSNKKHLGWLLAFIGILLSLCFMSANGGDFFGGLGGGLFLGAPFLIIYILLRLNNKKKLDAALIKFANVSTELNDYYAAYGYCPVGFEFTNPFILQKIYEVIRIGRANNPTDAINLILEDLHKEKMEKEAQATRIAAEEGAKQSKKAARYSAANFWFKD